jgi:hypothetical protein
MFSRLFKTGINGTPRANQYRALSLDQSQVTLAAAARFIGEELRMMCSVPYPIREGFSQSPAVQDYLLFAQASFTK